MKNVLSWMNTTFAPRLWKCIEIYTKMAKLDKEDVYWVPHLITRKEVEKYVEKYNHKPIKIIKLSKFNWFIKELKRRLDTRDAFNLSSSNCEVIDELIGDVLE